MRYCISLLFLLTLTYQALAMGVVPPKTPLIETESSSPRFEGMGGISIAVDDPEGDFRINPAKAVYLGEGIFYAYPSISVFTDKRTDTYSSGDQYNNSIYNYEFHSSNLSAIPELGFIKKSEYGVFYGLSALYQFNYTYTIDKSSRTSDTTTESESDRTKEVKHRLPVNLIVGKDFGKGSFGLGAGVNYDTSESEYTGYYASGFNKTSEQTFNLLLKPGLVIFTDEKSRFSLFLDLILFSKGEKRVNEDYNNSIVNEKYGLENERINGEIEFVKDFNRISLGILSGFFSEKRKIKIDEGGIQTSLSFTTKEGFKLGAGICGKPTNSTILGSDLIYSKISSEQPYLIDEGFIITDLITTGEIDASNIQWKTGVEQRLNNFAVRFGYIMIWNIIDSNNGDFEGISMSQGYKYLSNAVTAGFSIERGAFRFDYLLRFNNFLTIVNPEIVNTFGFIVRI